MTYRHKRYLKNLLINKGFQLKFLLRFFVFSFIVLTIGGAIQYFISNKTILNELSKINDETIERQKKIITFIQTSEHATNPRISKLPPPLKNLIQKTFKEYNQFLKSEIRFVNTQINHAKTILAKNTTDLFSAFWGSLILVGLIVNIIFALVYGVLLSHRIAGNHYRLQLFAKQLQDKNLVTPLRVRGKDFFQETATEFDRARVTLQTDLKTIYDGEGKDVEVLKSYKL